MATCAARDPTASLRGWAGASGEQNGDIRLRVEQNYALGGNVSFLFRVKSMSPVYRRRTSTFIVGLALQKENNLRTLTFFTFLADFIDFGGF